MKRRVLAPVLALMLVLAACSAGPKAADYTVEDAQKLLEAGAFSGEMEAVDGDVVSALYGLDSGTVQACAGYMAINTSVSADEVTVLVLADEEGAKAAAEACQKRVASQIESCRDYCPGQVPRLEEAVISRRGNTVLLAVGDPDKLPQALDELGLG